MPPDIAECELMAAMGTMVQVMDRSELMLLREMLIARHGVQSEMLELIDGNLALREIRELPDAD